MNAITVKLISSALLILVLLFCPFEPPRDYLWFAKEFSIMLLSGIGILANKEKNYSQVTACIVLIIVLFPMPAFDAPQMIWNMIYLATISMAVYYIFFTLNQNDERDSYGY